MKAVNAFGKVFVKVCAVCMGVLIVDTAYNKGKRDAYKECYDFFVDEAAKLKDMKNEEEAE